MMEKLKNPFSMLLHPSSSSTLSANPHPEVKNPESQNNEKRDSSQKQEEVFIGPLPIEEEVDEKMIQYAKD
mgnify:CR=1 FL=1